MAHVLTGWSVALQETPPRALFRPGAHQPGVKMMMGQSIPEGPGGLEAALGFLAAHPATLRSLARKLVRHFVADDPPEGAVTRVAGVLAATGGDLKAAALAVVGVAEAWTPLGKLRSPADLVLAMARALDLPPAGERLRGAMGTLGQGVMNAPLPNGWPDTAADWAGPEAMMRRIDLAYTVAGRGAGLEPMAVAELALGPLRGAATGQEMRRAGSRREALALLFASPEFQRR